MLHFFLWYLFISALGLLTFPLAYRLLPALSDRGYALSRTLGLLVWGYLFWLLGSLGILRNDLGGELLALIILVALSAWALRREGWLDIRYWMKAQRRLVVTVEILFLLAFALLAFIRSANPEILGTEKPMELAFINSILRSPTLPPNDPWLSGYAISYYHFGYILVAMLARLAGTSGGVAFNLGISLVFALAAVGSYGVLYNLLNRQESKNANGQINTSTDQQIAQSPIPPSAFSIRNSLLAPFFVLIVSNLGGLLHLLRMGRVFWSQNEAGEWVSSIWTWLDIGNYALPPTGESFPHWWWWQASRIVQDFDFNWTNKGDVIDEFPFFSFLLGDLHPHVLAMPFAFLAIGLALNLFYGGAEGKMRWLWMRIKLNPLAFLAGSAALGSLAFLNTWDFPFYVALFAGAYLLRELLVVRENSIFGESPSIWKILWELIQLGLALGVTGVLLYLPFYFGFQSQAGGPLPNLIYITRGVYLWIMFMPFLVPIFGFLFHLWKSHEDQESFKGGIRLTLGLIGILLGLTLLLTFFISILRIFQSINPQAAIAADTFLGSLAAPGWWPLVLEGFRRRLIAPGTLLTLAVLLIFTMALLWPRRPSVPTLFSSLAPAHIFVLLLILIGALLVLAPEFVFLRDLFGYRINTIFKFYYQVWLMWGLAAAYATSLLWRKLRGGGKVAFQIGMVLLIGLALTYPVMGLRSKTSNFEPYGGFTLDGAAYLETSNLDEKAAMQWLRAAPLGVVAESIGGSYTGFARMSTNSGQPTVLGWDFHEMQWRGGTQEMGSRRSDIERMYCAPNWTETESILTQYNVRYVVVGSLEKITYGRGSDTCPSGMNEAKFMRNLPVVFQQGDVTIYEVPFADETSTGSNTP